VSTVAPWYERVFFAPYEFNYHFEHHAWPSMPAYHLGRMHRHLAQDGYFERHPEYFARSFFGSLRRQQREGRVEAA
jgi:fatty acid desaturase